MSKIAVSLLVATGVCFATMIANADAAVSGSPALDSGATAWVLTASALVLFMTLPGLTLFYGGLVRTDQLPAASCADAALLCDQLRRVADLAGVRI